MKKQVEKFFSPCLTVYWRGRFGNKPKDAWYPDMIADRDLLRQFMQEAGVDMLFGVNFEMKDYERILAAAGKHGYCIETIDIKDTIPCDNQKPNEKESSKKKSRGKKGTK